MRLPLVTCLGCLPIRLRGRGRRSVVPWPAMRVTLALVLLVGCSKASINVGAGGEPGSGTGGSPGTGGEGARDAAQEAAGGLGGAGIGGEPGTGGNGAGGALAGSGGAGVGGMGSGGAGTGGAGTGGTPGTGGSAADAGTDATPPATPTAAGQLVITEIMSDTAAALSDDVGEWFELYNPGPDALDLLGCYLSDKSHSDLVTAHVVIEPGAYAVMARSSTAVPVPAAFVYTTVKFSDTGDLAKVSCGSTVIDIVDFMAFPLHQGYAYSLSPAHLRADENDDATSWCAASAVYQTVGSKSDFGSPGRANPACP